MVPWSHERFLDSYTGPKRHRYEQAVESLKGRDVCVKDSYVATFVKMEKLNLSLKSDPDPRVIQPRDPRFNVALGVYIRPLEAVMFKAITRIFEEVTVLKGFNSRKQGSIIARKWEKYGRPAAVSFDCVRQDQHMSRSALAYRAELYQLFYRGDARLAELLEWQCKIRGFAREGQEYVQYLKVGGGASGDMDTSLRSCLMSVAILYAYMIQQGLDLSAINNGDDTTAILEETDVHRLQGLAPFSSALGFPMTIEPPVTELEHLTFCQTQPVCDGRDWFMVRNPWVCMSKDLVSVKHFDDPKSFDTLRNSVGRSGEALAGHMPVFRSFYKALYKGAGTRIDRDAVETGFAILARGMYNSGVITQYCRYSFYKAFGITPDEQTALERYYDKVDYRWQPTKRVDVYSVPTHAKGTLMGSPA